MKGEPKERQAARARREAEGTAELHARLGILQRLEILLETRRPHSIVRQVSGVGLVRITLKLRSTPHRQKVP